MFEKIKQYLESLDKIDSPPWANLSDIRCFLPDPPRKLDADLIHTSQTTTTGRSLTWEVESSSEIWLPICATIRNGNVAAWGRGEFSKPSKAGTTVFSSATHEVGQTGSYADCLRGILQPLLLQQGSKIALVDDHWSAGNSLIGTIGYYRFRKR